MFCPDCGKKLPDGAIFCSTCGAKMQSNTSAVCENCGRELHKGARFCAKCGAAVVDAPAKTAQPTPVPQPQTITEARQFKQAPPAAALKNTATPNNPAAQKSTASPKRSGGRKTLSIALAVLLVMQAAAAVILFGWPGVLAKGKDDGIITGLSAIKPASADYKAEPEKMNVSYDDHRAEFDSGVIVDFGIGNLEKEEELSVKSLGVKTDGEYEARLYDFDLGKTDRFPKLVEITVQYDASWGDDVFVQYYNEKTRSWEIMWSEVNGPGSVTFWTEHFSTFGIFKDYVENGGGSDGPVYVLRDGTPTMMSKCSLNVGALARQMRESNVSVQSLKGGTADTYGTESMLSIINNTGTFGSYMLSASDFIGEAAGGYAKFGALSDAIGKAGNVMTVGKILLQAQRTGNIVKTLKDNGNDIAQMILSGAGAAIGGTAATVFGAAALCLYVYGTTSSIKDSVDLMGYEDTTEYAYRLFTNNYVTYIMKDGRCSFKYAKTEMQRQNLTWQATEVQLYTDSRGEGKWMTVFDYLFKKYKDKPEMFVPAINTLIDDYCTVFWRIQDSGNKAFKMFLENSRAGALSFNTLADVYQTPSKTEQDMYTARFKAEVKAWLKPIVDEYAKKAYIQTLNLALQNALALEQELNETISFTMVDEKHKNFSDSPYAAYSIGIRQYKYSKDWWTFNEANKYTISCTRFMFLSVGMPKYVDIRKSGDEIETITMRITDPRTYITLESGDFPSFDELTGLYENGTVTLSDVEVSDWLYGFLEKIGAEVTPGDGVGTAKDVPFRIGSTDKNKGTIESEEFTGTAEYDPDSGKMRVKIRDTEGNTMKGELACTYNSNKTGVAVSGELSGSASLIASFSLALKGSKNLSAN